MTSLKSPFMRRLVQAALFFCATMAATAAPALELRTESQLEATWLMPVAPAATGALPPAVQQALAQAQLPQESLAVAVQALPGVAVPGQRAGQPLAAPLRLRYQAEQAMNPASTMKLVSTYAALDALGPDFVWRTPVWVQGLIRGGVLDGDVIVQGMADPDLTLERARLLAQKLYAAGVHEIRGDFVVDNQLFDLPKHDAAAFDGRPDRPYNAGPQALLFNRAALQLQVQAQSEQGVASVALLTPLAGVTVNSELPLVSGACGQLDRRLQLKKVGANLRFGPGYPASCGQKDLYWAYDQEPELLAARALAGLWQEAGGVLQGEARLGTVPKGARLLFRQPSLPLAEVIRTINQYSNNVMTQQVFLSAPLFSAPPAQMGRGSFMRSQRWLTAWWQERVGAAVPAPKVQNGSGLSRSARISPAALVALLETASQGPHFAVYYESLAMAGEEGTLKKMRRRSPGNAALGRAKLKTGTLDDVKAIAGYVQGQSGQLYALAAVINHPSRAHAGQAALDALLDWLVAHG